MPNQEATSVADTLVTGWFTKYGTPTYLHSDQGAQVESRLLQEVCQPLGIKKAQTTPLHPQRYGQSERSIKNLMKMLVMATQEQDEWDTPFPFIPLVYRATPQESTGIIPNFLMFSRETAMPIDLMVRQARKQDFEWGGSFWG